ncbi:hypothetical protein [Mycoplasmopsis cynos]|uniref:hypothetical protein n=1 Tax=Mycoplasmopsis cynos TaxID=171284 RepID=UPI002208DC6E|nr:hypothetical protein [Mycoplasmopsis cynos]UWV93097.1 hypothetical protein NWE57_04865 [Mycoplasmopsis cynos]
MTVNDAFNKIRAFSSNPGAYLFFQNKRLKVYYASKDFVKNPRNKFIRWKTLRCWLSIRIKKESEIAKITFREKFLLKFMCKCFHTFFVI